MASRQAAPANATRFTPGAAWRDQVRHDWSETAALWERFEPSLMYALGGVDPVLFRALALKPGQRVLDIGCGLGEPSLGVAAWVAPRGEVIALDVSAPMLAIARRRARANGLTNIRFHRAAIERYAHTGPRVDRAVSRFGLMFADDPPAALHNIRAALKPRGRIALAVWAPLDRNPLFACVQTAAAPHLTETPPDPEDAPHPMRFARPERLPALLRQAGFHHVRVVEARTQFVFASPAEFAQIHMQTSATLRRLLASLTTAKRAKLQAALVRGADRFVTGTVVRFPGSAWIVAAER